MSSRSRLARVTDPELGRRIRVYRDRRGLSQEGLAHQVGRSEGWLLKVENGRTEPSSSDLVRLAERLAVRVELLLHGETSNGRHVAMNVSKQEYAPDRSMVTIMIHGQFNHSGSEVAKVVHSALHEAGVCGCAEGVRTSEPTG